MASLCEYYNEWLTKWKNRDEKWNNLRLLYLSLDWRRNFCTWKYNRFFTRNRCELCVCHHYKVWIARPFPFRRIIIWTNWLPMTRCWFWIGLCTSTCYSGSSCFCRSFGRFHHCFLCHNCWFSLLGRTTDFILFW